MRSCIQIRLILKPAAEPFRPRHARGRGAPSEECAHLAVDRMTTSTDVTELSPLTLSTEDARLSLDDVLGSRLEQKPSPAENEAMTVSASPENECEGIAFDEDDIAPCCQRTGPCRWDVVCRTHIRRWEAAHGEPYLGFLERTGGVVPAWLQSAEDGVGEALPGQRGSAAAVATNAADFEEYANDENDELDDVGLLGNGGHDALVEVAGRGEADGEPTPFGANSVMELDDDDGDARLKHGGDASGFDALDPVIAAAMARGSEAQAEAAGALWLDETADLEA